MALILSSFFFLSVVVRRLTPSKDADKVLILLVFTKYITANGENNKLQDYNPDLTEIK